MRKTTITYFRYGEESQNTDKSQVTRMTIIVPKQTASTRLSLPRQDDCKKLERTLSNIKQNLEQNIDPPPPQKKKKKKQQQKKKNKKKTKTKKKTKKLKNKKTIETTFNMSQQIINSQPVQFNRIICRWCNPFLSLEIRLYYIKSISTFSFSKQLPYVTNL